MTRPSAEMAAGLAIVAFLGIVCGFALRRCAVAEPVERYPDEGDDGVQPADPWLTNGGTCTTCGGFQFRDWLHADYGCPTPMYPYGHGERIERGYRSLNRGCLVAVVVSMAFWLVVAAAVWTLR